MGANRPLTMSRYVFFCCCCFFAVVVFLLFVRCQVYFILFYFFIDCSLSFTFNLKNDKSSYANVTGHTTEHGRKQELLNQHKHKRKEGDKCMNQ